MKQENGIVDKPYGQIGYEAYAKAVGNKSWNSDSLQIWENLPQRIKNAWHAAAIAAINSYMAIPKDWAKS